MIFEFSGLFLKLIFIYLQSRRYFSGFIRIVDCVIRFASHANSSGPFHPALASLEELGSVYRLPLDLLESFTSDSDDLVQSVFIYVVKFGLQFLDKEL
jgi:hypothetical protein